MAHVIPEGILRAETLRRYVDALDDPALPLADFRWNSLRSASIHSVVRRGEAVSVQTAYHRGWHARANGRAATVQRDGLGFLTILPGCDGPCEIELTYDGGWEYKLCRALSYLTILGMFGYCWSVTVRARKSRTRRMCPYFSVRRSESTAASTNGPPKSGHRA